jgi:hypothetical protein
MPPDALPDRGSPMTSAVVAHDHEVPKFARGTVPSSAPGPWPLAQVAGNDTTVIGLVLSRPYTDGQYLVRPATIVQAETFRQWEAADRTAANELELLLSVIRASKGPRYNPGDTRPPEADLPLGVGTPYDMATDGPIIWFREEVGSNALSCRRR